MSLLLLGPRNFLHDGIHVHFIDWGLCHLVLNCRRCKFGAENAPARDYMIGLSRLARCWSCKLLHRCTPCYQALLLLSRRRCLIDLVMLNVQLVSNRLNDQAFFSYLGGRTGSTPCHHDIFNTAHTWGAHWILDECHTMLVVVMIIRVELLLLIVWVSCWMDLISVQNMLVIVHYWASCWDDI